MNSKTILFIIIGLLVVAGGVGAVFFLKKDDEPDTISGPPMPTKKLINLPIGDNDLKSAANQLLTEQELKDLQSWMLLIINERKKAKKAGTNKWVQADTDLGLLKSALYEMNKKGKLKSMKLADVYQQLSMLQY